MKAQSALSKTAGAWLAAVALAACSSAPQVPAKVAVPPSQSVAQANQRLARVAKERAAIEAHYAEAEHACYQRFFVNHCLDKIKESRRTALAEQRAIEIEASHFLRQARVDERDRAMAEADARYKEEEARLAAEPPQPPRAPTEVPPPRPSPVAERVAKHNEKMREVEARERAEAGKRAENVAAFNKRKAEAEARQREVARRKAEKAAKEQAKEEAKEQKAAPANSQ
ncbi:hypothetical protein [Massilia horti]|uniref:Lipoprotein n=1 Tax=Massilia horti TaxID=2562153 RepID=A0A4Y9SPS8_9BURK|nr:hypothetical protein [Massilia horti]TFW28571.1 hypothetical protein E4O92_20835 [Massilia horti]